MLKLRSSYIYCLIAALFFLNFEGSWAQTSQLNPKTALKNYEIRSWKEIDDVPLGRVFDIDQDEEGFIWLATGRGLLRFDSQKIEPYNFKNVDFLRTETIREVEIGSNERIWFSTRRGLYYLEDKEVVEVKNPEGNSVDKIRNLAIDARGVLYFTSRESNELFKVIGETIHKISKPGEQAYSVFKTKKGGVVTKLFRQGQTIEFLEFDAEGKESRSLYDAQEIYSLFGMAEGVSGGMYAGTQFNTIVKLQNGIVEEVVPYNGNGFPLEYIEVQNSEAIFYSQGTGLSRYFNGKVETLHVEDGLSNNAIRSIFTDRDGNLWVGTLNGLNYISNGPFSNIELEDALQGDEITSFNQLEDQTLIVGTRKSGLLEIEGSTLVPVSLTETIGSNINSLLKGVDPNTFLVGSEEGLFLMKKEKSQYIVVEKISDKDIRITSQRSNGEVWFSAKERVEGSNRLEDKIYVRTLDKKTIPIEKAEKFWINSVYEDSDGTLWFGTIKGVFKHKEGTEFILEKVPEFKSYIIGSIVSMNTDAFWISTEGSGVFMVKNDSIQKFDTRNGLSNNRSRFLLASEEGGFWTYIYNEGFGKLERLIPYVDQGVQKLGVGENYTFKVNADGIVGFPNEISNADGSFYIGSRDKIIRFNPKDITYRQPHVTFDKLVVDGALIKKDDYENISYSLEDFEFHFSSVDFIRGEQQLFEVKLEGWDESWRSVGKRQVVYYSRLPSGEYTFKVRLHTPEFGKIEIENPIHINKQFVWYKKRGVLFVFAILFAVGIFSIFQYRINRVKKQRTILQAKVAERTAELNTLNQNLEATVEERTKEIFKINEELTEKEERYKYALEASNDGIWDWDVKSDKIQFSPAIYTMLGFEPYEFPETRLALYEQIHPEEIRKEHIDYHTRLRTEPGDEILLDEYRMVGKAGNVVWIQVKGKIVERDEKGLPVRMVGTHVDITKDKEKNKEVLDAVLNTEFVERSRISKDIHDGLQQTLTIASLNLQWVRKDLEGLTDKAKEKFEQGWKYLQNSITESRNVAHSLMPKEVLDFGVISAFETTVNEIDNAMEGTQFNFYHNFKSEKIENQQIEIILYRILQEALNNITKYAEAKTVTIQLKDYDDMYMLTIEDDGKGFDVEKLKARGKGMGFKSMQNRLDAINGFLEIDSMPGSGTTILVEINK